MLPKGFHFDNTEKVKKLAQETSLDTPEGNETYQHNAGDTVQATNTSPYKEGTTFTIKDRYMENGFAYYRDTNNRIHRNKDIKELPCQPPS